MEVKAREKEMETAQGIEEEEKWKEDFRKRAAPRAQNVRLAQQQQHTMRNIIRLAHRGAPSANLCVLRKILYNVLRGFIAKVGPTSLILNDFKCSLQCRAQQTNELSKNSQKYDFSILVTYDI